MDESNPSPRVVLAITSSTAFLEIEGMANLVRAIMVLANVFPSHTFLIAVTEKDVDRVHQLLEARSNSWKTLICEPTEPGSLARALAPELGDCDDIMIHDASRSLTPPSQFMAVMSKFSDEVDAVRPALPFTETLKIVGRDSVIIKTLDRSSVLRIGTPELIRVSAIDVDADDSGWFLPLRKDARILHIDGTPEGTRMNTTADRDLMELQHN